MKIIWCSSVAMVVAGDYKAANRSTGSHVVKFTLWKIRGHAVLAGRLQPLQSRSLCMLSITATILVTDYPNSSVSIVRAIHAKVGLFKAAGRSQKDMDWWAIQSIRTQVLKKSAVVRKSIPCLTRIAGARSLHLTKQFKSFKAVLWPLLYLEKTIAGVFTAAVYFQNGIVALLNRWTMVSLLSATKKVRQPWRKRTRAPRSCIWDRLQTAIRLKIHVRGFGRTHFVNTGAAKRGRPLLKRMISGWSKTLGENSGERMASFVSERNVTLESQEWTVICCGWLPDEQHSETDTKPIYCRVSQLKKIFLIKVQQVNLCLSLCHTKFLFLKNLHIFLLSNI